MEFGKRNLEEGIGNNERIRSLCQRAAASVSVSCQNHLCFVADGSLVWHNEISSFIVEKNLDLERIMDQVSVSGFPHSDFSSIHKGLND